MPVDYSRYPSNWKTVIRPSILERAGNQCEWCGVRNGAIGHRLADGSFHHCTPCETQTGDPDDCPLGRAVRIVLTIAHIFDPDPHACEPENLAALCQRCHNRHDMPMRQANAAATRRARKVAGGQGQLLT